MLCWVKEENGLRQLFRNEFPNELMENGRAYCRFEVIDLNDKSIIAYLYQPLAVQLPNVPDSFALADEIRKAKRLGDGVALTFDIVPSSSTKVEQGFGLEANMQMAEEVRNLHKHYNENTNQSVRQLAFAGIAVIWLFKVGLTDAIYLPRSVIAPLLLFVITLALDFAHFALGSLIFGRRISELCHGGLIHRVFLAGTSLSTEKRKSKALF